jgi:tetratricopeptide (TPR) repeat protein
MVRLFSLGCVVALILGCSVFAAPAAGQAGEGSGISLSVDLKSGAVVSDIYLVTAIAISNKGIAKVDFLVDGKLAGTDSSTPYTFEWDTVEYDDGEHTLSVVASDLSGNQERKEIKVTVDNDLAAGVEAHLEKGKDFLAVGNAEKALLEGRKALRSSPDSPEALRFVAGVYEGAGMFDKAAEYFEKAVAKEPSDVQLRRTLSLVYVKLAARQSPTGTYSEVMQKAISEARAASDIEFGETERKAQASSAPMDTYLFGKALLERGDYESALAKFLASERAEPQKPLYRDAAAIASIFAGKIRDAEVTFDWLKRQQMADYLTSCAMCLSRLVTNQFDSAREEIGRALGLEPNLVYVLLLAGLTEVRKNDQKKAAEYIDKALEQSPDSAVAHYYKAGILTGERKYEDALTEVNRAIELDPTLADAHALKAVLWMLKDWVQQIDPMVAAKASLDVALSVDPKSPYALCLAAVWADEQGKDDELLDYATRASEAAPNEPYVQVVLARAYQKHKEPEKMREAMQKAFELDKVNFSRSSPPSSWEMLEMINRFGRRPVATLP